MTATDPAEPLLEKMTPEERALVQQLRTFIKEALPQVSETVHMGWRVINYGSSEKMRDMIAALVPHRTYVNLQFADGVDLPDPAQRLQGTGKRMRHVKIRTSEDVRHPDVRALLVAAAHHRGL